MSDTIDYSLTPIGFIQSSLQTSQNMVVRKSTILGGRGIKYNPVYTSKLDAKFIASWMRDSSMTLKSKFIQSDQFPSPPNYARVKCW